MKKVILTIIIVAFALVLSGCSKFRNNDVIPESEQSTPVITPVESTPTLVPTTVPTPVHTTVPTPVHTTVPTPVHTTVPMPVPAMTPTPVPTAVPTTIPTAEPTLEITPDVEDSSEDPWGMGGFTDEDSWDLGGF